jgi:hypothetical protein
MIVENDIWVKRSTSFLPNTNGKFCREHNYEMPEFVTPKEPHDFKIISRRNYWILLIMSSNT